MFWSILYLANLKVVLIANKDIFLWSNSIFCACVKFWRQFICTLNSSIESSISLANSSTVNSSTTRIGIASIRPWTPYMFRKVMVSLTVAKSHALVIRIKLLIQIFKIISVVLKSFQPSFLFLDNLFKWVYLSCYLLGQSLF